MQYVSLSDYIKRQVENYPRIKIIGHANVPRSGKTCPNFSVLEFCQAIGLPEINIGY
jgi:hypothetical protein